MVSFTAVGIFIAEFILVILMVRLGISFASYYWSRFLKSQARAAQREKDAEQEKKKKKKKNKKGRKEDTSSEESSSE